MKKKIWLVTGISSGLGKALSDHLLKTEVFVIGTFRNAQQVEEFNSRNEEKGYSYELDLTDSEQVEQLIESIKHDYGTIDVLVNNAGAGFIGAIEETSMEETRQLFEANFFGTLHLTKLVLPIMRSQKSGSIIQISSHGGIKAFAGFGIYNATKFALEGFSEALAQEVENLGIKVCIVEPGPFRTEFAGSGLNEAVTTISDYKDTAGAFRSMLKNVHGKQEGDPVKAASAIVQHVISGIPTLRLPLGSLPLKTIQAKIDSVQRDLRKSKKIAESVVYQ